MMTSDIKFTAEPAAEYKGPYVHAVYTHYDCNELAGHVNSLLMIKDSNKTVRAFVMLIAGLDSSLVDPCVRKVLVNRLNALCEQS